MTNVIRIMFYLTDIATVIAIMINKSIKPWQYLFCFAVLNGIILLENKLDDLMKQYKKPEGM